jgi:hypothetical protein
MNRPIQPKTHRALAGALLLLAPSSALPKLGPWTQSQGFEPLGPAGELVGAAEWSFDFQPTPGVELTYMPLPPELGSLDMSKVGQGPMVAIRLGRAYHLEVDGAIKHRWAGRDLEYLEAGATYVSPCEGFVPATNDAEQTPLIQEQVGSLSFGLAEPGPTLDLAGGSIQAYFGVCGEPPVLRGQLR